MGVRALASAFAIAASLACVPAAAQVQRSFVASYGSDANTATNCGFSAPCRGFAAAQGVTNSNGEIVAIDSAGFGPLTITKSISVVAAPGAYAGISVAGGNAVTVATPGVKVRLSGLKINATASATGVNFTSGTSLNIEGCTFSGFSTAGVVNAAAEVRITDSVFTNNVTGATFDGGASAAIASSQFLGNSNAGVSLPGLTTAPTSVVVTHSVASHSSGANGVGFLAVAGVAGADVHLAISNSSADLNQYGVVSATNAPGTATVLLASSKVTRNSAAGLLQSSGSGGNPIFRSAGNNLVSDNAANFLGNITNIGTM